MVQMRTVLARDVLPVEKRYQVQYILPLATSICVETNICFAEGILPGARKYQGMNKLNIPDSLQRNMRAGIYLVCSNQICVRKQISLQLQINNSGQY